jgi:hypothetical protein
MGFAELLYQFCKIDFGGKRRRRWKVCYKQNNNRIEKNHMSYF